MTRFSLGSRRGVLALASAVLVSLALQACDDQTTPTQLKPAGPSLGVGGSVGVDLDQCANLATPCAWQNGDLNGNNSAFAEGEVVPFRLAIEGLAPGTHTIHINYDFTAGGHEGYDFLATYNATETVDVCAAGGGGVSSLCPSLGTAVQVNFKSDPFTVPDANNLSVAGAQSAALFGVSNNRKLTIWGGTITDVTVPVHGGNTAGNSSADIVVTFTSNGSAVLLAWGAHLAQSNYWKQGTAADGAGQISGAPWHMRTQQLDVGNANKNQDRSIQPSAVVHPPAVTLTKVADAASVNAGSQIGFVITATNTGAGDATGFALSDPLPQGPGISWSIASQSGSPACVINGNNLVCPSSGTGTLAAGATLTVHIVSQTTAQSCGTYQNTATVSFATTTGGTVPPPAVASVTVNCAAINILKTADANTVSAGASIGFTITVSNSGAGTATGVAVTDALPAGLSWSIDGGTGAAQCSISSGTLSCNFGSMATGASLTVHISATTAFASCGTVTNTAYVTTTNDGSANSVASITVQCPSLSVRKTADAATVGAGSAIGFTITVSNAGPGDATSATLSDALPTGTGISWSIDPAYAGPGTCSITSNTLSCSFGTLGSGTSATVHVSSPTTGAPCQAYANTATAQATNHAQVTSSATTTVQCPVLTVSKTADAAYVSAGSSIGFTIAVSNSNAQGTGTATSVTLSDPLPTGTGITWSISPAYAGPGTCSVTGNTLSCSFGDLAPGASASVHVTSATAFASCKQYPNTATVLATNHAQVTGQATTEVRCPNLQIAKTPDQQGDAGYVVPSGGTATFTITVTNSGTGDATGTVLTDPLPSGFTWTDDSNSCDIVGNTLTCNLGTLAAGAPAFTVHVSASVPSNYTTQTPVANGTQIEIDGNLASNGGFDWATAGINCLSNPKAGCDLDKPTGATDDSFGQGTKEDTPVPIVVDGSIPNNKSDLTRFYVANNRASVQTQSGTAVHDFLYLAWERVQEPNGTTNMDFEINQSTTPSDNTKTPVRTAGDILIKYDLSKGGGSLTLGYHKWVTAASAGGQTPAQACEAANAFPCWGKVNTLAAPTATGASNTVANNPTTGTVSDAINPDATRTLSVLTFGEASVDLQASGIFQQGACVTFAGAYLKSRSSDSFTSEIKDFIAPISMPPISNCADRYINNSASVSATNFAPPNGSQGDPLSDNGQIKVPAATSASLNAAPGGTQLAQADAVGPMTTTGVVTSGMVTTASDAFDASDRAMPQAPGTPTLGRSVWKQAASGTVATPTLAPAMSRDVGWLASRPPAVSG